MLKYFGINRAIGLALMKRFWSIIAAPMTMVLIAVTLTKAEQGYYFTFTSLLALQVFFELGLVTVIAQFISHEFVSLSWGTHGEIIGDLENRKRVLNILGNSLKWYFFCSILLITSLSIAGYLFFFNETNVNISWKLPWLLAVFGVGVNLLIVPFYAFITGSGDVASVNLRALIGGILGTLLGWCVLFLGGGLYAIPALTLGSFSVGIIYLIKSKPILFKQGIFYALNKMEILHPVSWRHEIWPMQWKIAASWISGYFIFQLFVPVLFKFHGPVVAGQMGMTLSLVNAIQVICLIWPTSKMPEFGKFIAQKKWFELDLLFEKTLRHSLEACLALLTVFLILLVILENLTNFSDRFLPTWQMAIFSVSIVAQLLISNWAIYMRAHKKEPMILVSAISALLIGLSTFVSGYYFSSLGMIVGFVLITTIYVLPATYKLFKNFKRIHHA